MDPQELLALVDSLEPEGQSLPDALALLRLVVINNPEKTATELRERSDVRDAIAAVELWLADASAAVIVVAGALPVAAGRAMRRDTALTLTKFREDITFNDARIGEWREDPTPHEVWGSRIVLRIQWFLDWLRRQVEWMGLRASYKRWVSQLAPNTCSYCRALHGVVLPVGRSFAAEARKVGWTRIYGGLFGPPLHPSCQCWLEAFTQEEYDALVDTAGTRRAP